MEKLKDFIYDKNDILVALLVLVVAAVIIWWRMGVIMDYPETVFSTGVQAEAEQDADENGGENSDAAQGEDSQNGDASLTGGENGNNGQAAGTSLWQGGALTRDVEVDVYGATASAAVQCLVDAGLFSDYDEYKQICQEAGLDHEKVSAGSLLFEKGSSKEDVAKKINWS